jgi:hypothetical protein
MGKGLVIDASIARACGDEKATYPTSVHCRNFLLAVQDGRYVIVMTPGIRAEWDKHQSAFARQWRAKMVSKRKLLALPEQFDGDLWESIPDTARSNQQRDEIAKDILLLEAALATDQSISSLDENTARRFFTRAAKVVPKIREIIWVNPDKPEETPIEWLQAGAPADEFRMLGNAE